MPLLSKAAFPVGGYGVAHLPVRTLPHRLSSGLSLQRIPRALILELKDAFLICIYHMGILILVVPLMVHPIIQVQMLMEDDLLLIFL